jgi:O-antigen ligase
VSSILGLGAMAAFLIAVTMTTGAIYKILFLSCAAWLAAQSALTFSRGGLVGAASAILVASFYLVRDRNTRLAFLFGAGFIVLVSAYMVVPALNDFTGEALEERFTETHLTGRELIIKGDLLAFAENPWLGVGPGESREYHEIFFRSSQAHTEFTRLLAEHGLPGLVALSLLLLMVVRRFRAKLPPLEMAYAASFTTWALLFMTHAAMRMAAPGFLFGVAASFFVAYKVQKGVPAGQLAAYDRRQGSRLVLRRPGRAVLVSRPGAVGEGRPRLWGGG